MNRENHTISWRKNHMNRVVISSMNMCNLPLHSFRNSEYRKMIRDKEPISMAFQIGLLEFHEVMVPMSEGAEHSTEFLSHKSIISK